MPKFGELPQSVRVTEANYIIYLDGSRYKARNGLRGHIEFSDTDLATVIQDAMDADVCNDVLLKLKGTHYLTDMLTMSLGNQRLRGLHTGSTPTRSTTLKLAAGVNKGIISVTQDFCAIKDLNLDGNKANQVGGYNGITASINGHHLFLDYVFVTQCGELGFYMRGMHNHIDRCIATYCKYGWYFYQLTELNVFKELGAGYNSVENIHMSGCVGVKVFGLLATLCTDWGVILDECSNTEIYGADIELNGHGGLAFAGSVRCSLIGGTIRNNSQGHNNTYDDINFGDNLAVTGIHSLYNNVINLQLYAALANVSRYAVRENDVNQDYNLIFGCRTFGHGTGEVSLQGVNSVSLQNR